MVTDKLKRQIEAEKCQIEEEEEEKEFFSSYSISADPASSCRGRKKMLNKTRVSRSNATKIFKRRGRRFRLYTSVDQNESYDDFSAMAQDDEVMQLL